MSKQIYLLLIGALFLVGCSSDDPVQNPVADTLHFKLKVDDTELDLGPTSPLDQGGVVVGGDLISIGAQYGFSTDSENLHQLHMTFDRKGNFISGEQRSVPTNGVNYVYQNYENFSANYFKVNILSIDETNKRIKLNFSGKFYLLNGLQQVDLNNSLPIVLNGDLDLNYSGEFGAPLELSRFGVPQYCTANLNNDAWRARREEQDGVFSSTDPYVIEMHFAQSAQPGSFSVDPSATATDLKFFKFNPTTLQFEEYAVTGTLSYSYREFHGANKYSFIGTFDANAVNPNNPADVIHLTSGSFRSIEQY